MADIDQWCEQMSVCDIQWYVTRADHININHSHLLLYSFTGYMCVPSNASNRVYERKKTTIRLSVHCICSRFMSIDWCAKSCRDISLAWRLIMYCHAAGYWSMPVILTEYWSRYFTIVLYHMYITLIMLYYYMANTRLIYTANHSWHCMPYTHIQSYSCPYRTYTTEYRT